jgi:serine/threonine-protein kinase RsbW
MQLSPKVARQVKGVAHFGNKQHMERNANIAVVPVGKSLDILSAPQLRALVNQLIREDCLRMILNFAETEFVDSAGMGMLFSSVRSMRSHGGLLSCINVSARVMRIFTIYRLVDYAPVERAGQHLQVEELDPSVRAISHNVIRVEKNNLSCARSRVEELMRHLGFDGDALFDMTLAVGEAMGNAIDHTCEGGVLATVTGYPDRVVVDVSDCGCGYELAPDDEPTSSVDEMERGRGIKLMRLLADSVSISRRQSGRGTLVRLVKLHR